MTPIDLFNMIKKESDLNETLEYSKKYDKVPLSDEPFNLSSLELVNLLLAVEKNFKIKLILEQLTAKSVSNLNSLCTYINYCEEERDGS